MKAAVRTRFGAPEVVRVIDIQEPVIKENELLVKVHATTVNRTDCAFRSAKPFINRLVAGPVKPRTTVLGTEFAGMVAAVGTAVTSFGVGDRVFGFRSQGGAHAEYVAISEDGAVATMPSNVTYEQAAPGTEGSHYALSLIRGAKIRRGQDVLVNGASGGIGSAAVQLLRVLGANVTAVCGTENVELVKGLGADRVIDYKAEDFTTEERTYDVVIDAVGKSSFGRCRGLLKPGGIYLSSELGRLSQNPFLAVVTPLLRGKRVMFPIPKLGPEIMGYLKKLIESGEFMPVIDRRYPLGQIVEAYRYVETGQKIGNVVISVEPATLPPSSLGGGG